MSKSFHVHQVSDATGETLNAIAKAALAQFEGVTVHEHAYTLVRSHRQLARAVDQIRENPGLVFFTLASLELRDELVAQCKAMSVPCLDVLETPVSMMRQFLGTAETHRPGGQHEVDQRYLLRIEALNFTIQHDDGQSVDTLNDAEIILVGASRTSKTPTCVYPWSPRGQRAAGTRTSASRGPFACDQSPDCRAVGIAGAVDPGAPQPSVHNGRAARYRLCRTGKRTRGDRGNAKAFRSAGMALH